MIEGEDVEPLSFVVMIEKQASTPREEKED